MDVSVCSAGMHARVQTVLCMHVCICVCVCLCVCVCEFVCSRLYSYGFGTHICTLSSVDE